MKKQAVWLALVGVLLLCPVAGAIPPPWLLEGAKGHADLIVIAKMDKIEAVRGVNKKVGFEAAEVLKGKPPEKDGKPVTCCLLFIQRDVRPGGPIGVAVIGGTGHPKPQPGESALLFLRPAGEPGAFRIVSGAFGYVSLRPDKKDGLKPLRRRISGFRRSCKFIKDVKLRDAMDGYYQKALDFAEKQAKKPE